MGLTRTQFLLAETVDQAQELKFYQQVGESDPAAIHVLIQDGAGFHLRDEDARRPDNVRLMTLPGYRPELNPVGGREVVWLRFRPTRTVIKPNRQTTSRLSRYVEARSGWVISIAAARPAHCWS